MKASLWMFERAFGAMNGWRGGSGANTGAGVAGLPSNAGSEFGPSGMGWAASAGAARTSAAIEAATKRIAERMPDDGAVHAAGYAGSSKSARPPSRKSCS